MWLFAWIGQRTSKITPKNSFFLLQGTPMLLYWYLTTLLSLNVPEQGFQGSRGGFQITKWLPDHKRGLNWPKNIQNYPNQSLSALTGDPIAVILIVKRYTFSLKYLKWSFSFRVQKWFPDHKKAPSTTKAAWIRQTTPKTTQNILLFALQGVSRAVILAMYHSIYFR